MHRLLARFKADDRGAINLMAGVSIIVLRMVVGGAVDFARYSSAKSQTAAALEAAVLAGARTLMLTGDPSKAAAAAAKYYEENVAGRFAVESDSVQFSVTDENKTVTGSGNAYLPTTFLKVAGIDRLALVNAPAASLRRPPSPAAAAAISKSR